MPVDGDVVSVVLDGGEVRGRIVDLDGRTVSVAYDGHEGVLVATFQFALLGAPFPRQAVGGVITPVGVATAESLLRELACGDARVARHRAWYSHLIRDAAEELLREGALDGAMSTAEVDAARRAIRADRRHRGLNQRAAHAELRALDDGASIHFDARRKLVDRVEGRLTVSRRWVARSVLYPFLEAEVPWVRAWRVQASESS